jgi:DNA repair protein RadC
MTTTSNDTEKCYQRRLTSVVSEPAFESKTIKNSIDSSNYARQFYESDLTIYESMFLIMMNKANTVIAWAKISQGGVSVTVADPKIIAKYAIDSLASSVILVHNHPSGNKLPSNADNDLTKKVKSGLAIFDVALLDHIILTETEYYSFADEGKM